MSEGLEGEGVALERLLRACASDTEEEEGVVEARRWCDVRVRRPVFLLLLAWLYLRIDVVALVVAALEGGRRERGEGGGGGGGGGEAGGMERESPFVLQTLAEVRTRTCFPRELLSEAKGVAGVVCELLCLCAGLGLCELQRLCEQWLCRLLACGLADRVSVREAVAPCTLSLPLLGPWLHSHTNPAPEGIGLEVSVSDLVDNLLLLELEEGKGFGCRAGGRDGEEHLGFALQSVECLCAVRGWQPPLSALADTQT
ncbi:hypothetical protein B484DRAFT_423950 [Ochromonadaceae sp. CCMP2298]|nr:hypothetical protein B484DRAFT_423950 [Ochromonadaceae sp. CCMP2298]